MTGAHGVDVATGAHEIGGDAANGGDISAMPGVMPVEDGGARSYRGCVLSFDIETTGIPADWGSPAFAPANSFHIKCF